MKTERVKAILDSLPIDANTLAYGDVTLKDYIEGRMREQHEYRMTEWVTSVDIAKVTDLDFYLDTQPAKDSGDPVLMGLANAVHKLSTALHYLSSFASREATVAAEYRTLIARLLAIIFEQSERMKQLGEDDVIAEQSILGFMTGSLRNAEPKPSATNSTSNSGGSSGSSAGSP